jgi:hypothetical protein
MHVQRNIDIFYLLDITLIHGAAVNVISFISAMMPPHLITLVRLAYVLPQFI